MKAYSLKAVNDLEYIEQDIPECPDGWALVKVKAAGICSSDIPRIYKKGTYHFPTIPGHEFSGVVERVGSDADVDMVGKRVGVFPLIPCRNCEQCKQKHLGSRRDGGFAEYVAVPIWNLIEISDGIRYEEAAMLEPLSVALHAIKQGNVQKGDSVAIVGTGMIGFAAAQWAKSLGASNVSVVGRSIAKKVLSEKIGIDYLTIDELNNEYDIVLEAVGSNQAIDLSINIVKPAGTLIMMGNPEGDITLSQNTYWRILRKQLHLVGTWNSAYEKDQICDWYEAVNALKNHQIEALKLVSHTYDQNSLQNGLELMYKHIEPYCKVMTIWNLEE